MVPSTNQIVSDSDKVFRLKQDPTCSDYNLQLLFEIICRKNH